MICGCEKDFNDELERSTVMYSLDLMISGQRTADEGSGYAGTKASTKGLDEWPVLFTDIFIFNDDAMGLLDSYEHIEMPSRDRQQLQSRAGGKRIVVVANCPLESGTISGICCYADMEALAVEFLKDNPLHPFMSGETVIDAGNERSCIIELEPVMSEIRISGFNDGLGLKDTHIRLTGAVGRAELMRRDGARPVEFVESGSMRMAKGAALYCYPNNCREESMGSPFTKLIIEGRKDGKNVEIAIPVNRKGFGWKNGEEGISRNTLYLMNITLESGYQACVKPSQ